MEFKYFKAMRGRTIFQTPIEEVKRQYHKLALRYHPDRGGDLRAMQTINAEWDILRKRCYNIHEDSQGNVYTDQKQDAPDNVTEQFTEIIEKLIHMDGLTIEICGRFIWVGGSTREHRDSLKEMGFRWAPRKKLWYLAPTGWRKRGRRELSMEEIRQSYGSQIVEPAHAASRTLRGAS